MPTIQCFPGLSSTSATVLSTMTDTVSIAYAFTVTAQTSRSLLNVIDGLNREEMSHEHQYDKLGGDISGPSHEEITPHVMSSLESQPNRTDFQQTPLYEVRN